MSNTIDVLLSEAVGGTTLHLCVTGLKIFAVRLWLGIHLVKVAARNIGCGVEVDIDEDRSAKAPEG